MAAIFRDAPAGQISRLILGPRAFSYADENKAFVLPYAKATKVENELHTDDPEKATAGERAASRSQTSSQSDSNDELVEWYGADDPDNPQNWSTLKKTFTFFQICLLTFSGQCYIFVWVPSISLRISHGEVYSGSAIITPAQTTFVEIYGISAQASSLVLSMYVLGYVSRILATRRERSC
jgi:MFS transporter, DHA1 family, multidrug resistance protein